jgi:hypothetical protein
MNTEINPNPTIGRASVEAQELAKHLETAEVGDVFTYQQLNTLAKCDVQKRNTVLQTARRIAQRQRKIVFDTIVGVGIKRLSDEEIPDVGDASIKRSRNIAKKGMRTLACANLGKMTQETKVKAITAKTILGLFSESGSRKVRCLVEQGARTESDNLKIGNISALFGR